MRSLLRRLSFFLMSSVLCAGAVIVACACTDLDTLLSRYPLTLTCGVVALALLLWVGRRVPPRTEPAATRTSAPRIPRIHR